MVYFTGAAGNINPTSMINEENRTKNFKEQGQELAKYAIEADGSYEKINGGAWFASVHGTSIHVPAVWSRNQIVLSRPGSYLISHLPAATPFSPEGRPRRGCSSGES